MLVYDAHCHLEAVNQNDCLPRIAVVASAKLDEITKLVKLRNSISSYKIGFGIHPWYVDEVNNTINQLEIALNDYKPDFIGEIGLDYTKPNIELQKEIFSAQLKLANEFHLPVVIHCVRAYNDVLSILKTKCNLGVNGIIHAFNANVTVANQFIDLGFLLGIGRSIINGKILKSIHEIDSSSLVFESDAPFSAGFGNVSTKISDTFLYAQIVAKKLNINLIDLIDCSNNNVLNLFRK